MNGRRNLSLALLPLALVVVGCGSTDPGANNDGGSSGSCERPTGALLPWKLGNKWTYKVTQDGEVSQKVTTIEMAEPVGGMGPHATKMAYRVVTKKGATDQTISWQAPEGDKVLRYREQSFGAQTGLLELEEHWDPYKLHIDGTAEHMVAEKAWVETYRETKLPTGSQPVTTTAMDAWKVLSECETVQVLDKAWNALKVTKTGGDTKIYWYVPGVGKVKETGGQTEELVKYEEGP
ncbi:MAG TPA: hypothetical protein VK540_05640 [Polyangiaceae bacterium]|nr:hypothetical protein [Polyangiaceae bacterium]